MILCLDCGNTRLKWGLHENGRWLASGALPHAELAQLALRLPAGVAPDIAVGCNVAGAACAAQVEAALAMPVRWISASERQCGVVNGYDNPASLGADRWAALIGARAQHQGAVLVVLAGTATTIDVLEPEGQYRGGLILPGITLMTDSLAAGTAGLPAAQGIYQTIPSNTHDAIVSGAVHATLGAIERMFATLSVHQEALCLLSGGAADSLQVHLGLPLRRVDKLVLEGIACVAHDSAFRPA